MLEMLNITADAVNNVIVAEAIHRSAEKVQSGTAFFSAEKESDEEGYFAASASNDKYWREIRSS